jgi:hypothetical protein
VHKTIEYLKTRRSQGGLKLAYMGGYQLLPLHGKSL